MANMCSFQQEIRLTQGNAFIVLSIMIVFRTYPVAYTSSLLAPAPASASVDESVGVNGSAAAQVFPQQILTDVSRADDQSALSLPTQLATFSTTVTPVGNLTTQSQVDIGGSAAKDLLGYLYLLCMDTSKSVKIGSTTNIKANNHRYLSLCFSTEILYLPVYRKQDAEDVHSYEQEFHRRAQAFKYVEDTMTQPLPVSLRMTQWAQENNVDTSMMCSWNRIQRERNTHNELYIRYNGSQDMLEHYQNLLLEVIDTRIVHCSNKRYVCDILSCNH